MVEVPRWGTVIVSVSAMISPVVRNQRAADRPASGRGRDDDLSVRGRSSSRAVADPVLPGGDVRPSRRLGGRATATGAIQGHWPMTSNGGRVDRTRTP